MLLQHHSLPIAKVIMLAWRNLWRNRRRTLITLSSIALGFALAVFSIGLSDGSHNSMIRNAIDLGEGHLTIQPADYMQAPANHKYLAQGHQISLKLSEIDMPGHVEQRISLQVLASTAYNSIGVLLEGVADLTDHRLNRLKDQIISGDVDLIDHQHGILIGDDLARKLKVKLNSKIVLMAGKKGGDSQAQLGRVHGIFDSGLDDLDEFLILSGIEFTRLFLEGEGADLEKQPVTRMAVFLDDPDSIEHWRSRITMKLDSDHIQILSWRQMMPQLVQFIALDDAGSYIFLILILIMVVIGIINTVLMSVLERTREFGLLRALGINRGSLIALVIAETFLLSLFAVLIGWLVGGGIHLWFSNYGLDLSALIGEGTTMAGSYMDTIVYPELSWSRVLQLTLIIFICTMVTGIYPAIKAAGITPVEALRT